MLTWDIFDGLKGSPVGRRAAAVGLRRAGAEPSAHVCRAARAGLRQLRTCLRVTLPTLNPRGCALSVGQRTTCGKRQSDSDVFGLVGVTQGVCAR